MFHLFKFAVLCNGPSSAACSHIASPESLAGHAIARPASPTAPGGVCHIVLFRYRPEVTRAQRRDITQRFAALRHNALRDGKPYIAALEHGTQASLEQAGKGFQEAFIVTFQSLSDRDYYVGLGARNGRSVGPLGADPRHAAFKRFVAPFLADVLVFDFRLPAMTSSMPPEDGKR